MPDLRTIQSCRWGEPTLFLAHPLWLAAEEYPWSCRRGSVPHTVEDTTACRSCPGWESAAGDDRRNSGTVHQS